MLAESMAESASLKTTPTASESEMGVGDDEEYKPDQVNIKNFIFKCNEENFVKFCVNRKSVGGCIK